MGAFSVGSDAPRLRSTFAAPPMRAWPEYPTSRCYVVPPSRGEFWSARTGAPCRLISVSISVPACQSPGVILLREGISIAAAIEELVLIWSASEADEWTNRLLWIPL